MEDQLPNSAQIRNVAPFVVSCAGSKSRYDKARTHSHFSSRMSDGHALEAATSTDGIDDEPRTMRNHFMPKGSSTHSKHEKERSKKKKGVKSKKDSH